MKYINILFRLSPFFLLFFLPVISAATQLEEGFRWRSSVSDKAIMSDLQEMCRIEHIWSAFLQDGYRHKNIAIARIGIIYKNSVGTKYYRSYWVGIPENGMMSDKIPIFVSGSAHNVFHNLEALRILDMKDYNNHIVFGNVDKNRFSIIDSSKINNRLWYETLELFYKTEKTSGDKKIADSLTDRRIADHGLAVGDFDKIYAHSEQWLLYHLNDDDTIRLNLAKVAPLSSADRIERVVLLIHTNRDACAVCSQTISVFIRYLKQASEAILGLALIDPLVVVSSRTNYLERRSTAGHDGHVHDVTDIDRHSPVIYVALPDYSWKLTVDELPYVG